MFRERERGLNAACPPPTPLAGHADLARGLGRVHAAVDQGPELALLCGRGGATRMCHHPVVPPPKVEPREKEGGSVEVLVSGLPQSKEEDEIRSAVESHVGPVTLDLQRAEVAHMQTVQFLVGLADHLATQQRLLRIVYRSLPTDPDRTERILDDSGLLAHPNIVAVPTPT
jgi:hypothetical protein